MMVKLAVACGWGKCLLGTAEKMAKALQYTAWKICVGPSAEV